MRHKALSSIRIGPYVTVVQLYPMGLYRGRIWGIVQRPWQVLVSLFKVARMQWTHKFPETLEVAIVVTIANNLLLIIRNSWASKHLRKALNHPCNEVTQPVIWYSWVHEKTNRMVNQLSKTPSLGMMHSSGPLRRQIFLVSRMRINFHKL